MQRWSPREARGLRCRTSASPYGYTRFRSNWPTRPEHMTPNGIKQLRGGLRDWLGWSSPRQNALLIMKPKNMPLEEPLEFVFVLHIHDSRRIDHQLWARDLDPVEACPFTNMKVHTLYGMSERAVLLATFQFKFVRSKLKVEQRTQRSAARPKHRSRGKVQHRVRIDGKTHTSGEEAGAWSTLTSYPQ